MRISDYLLWLLATFGSLFFVSTILPDKWSKRVKPAYRAVVAVGVFLLIGTYWLTTGEKFDESLYRFLLCRVHNFERCSIDKVLAAKSDYSRQENSVDLAAGARAKEVEAEKFRQAEQEKQKAAEAERRRQTEQEVQRLATAAREREEEVARAHNAEQERRRLANESRAREIEMERLRQAEREQQRLATEVRTRETEIERLRKLERDRQRLADEAREREAEAERQRQVQREIERSRRYGATAVGRNEPTKGLRATTFVDQGSMADAESRALERCNQVATNCQIIARFSGPGKCVHIAGGTTLVRMPGRESRNVGARAGSSEADALQKCYASYTSCNVFHTRCNSGL
jgi:hypothetical protein